MSGAIEVAILYLNTSVIVSSKDIQTPIEKIMIDASEIKRQLKIGLKNQTIQTQLNREGVQK